MTANHLVVSNVNNVRVGQSNEPFNRLLLMPVPGGSLFYLFIYEVAPGKTRLMLISATRESRVGFERTRKQQVLLLLYYSSTFSYNLLCYVFLFFREKEEEEEEEEVTGWLPAVPAAAVKLASS